MVHYSWEEGKNEGGCDRVQVNIVNLDVSLEDEDLTILQISVPASGQANQMQ